MKTKPTQLDWGPGESETCDQDVQCTVSSCLSPPRRETWGRHRSASGQLCFGQNVLIPHVLFHRRILNEPSPGGLQLGRGLQELHYLSWHCSSQGHPRGGAEEPDVYPRSGKRGLVAGHSNVTAGNQLTPSGSSQAIHHGNDRDGVILDQHHDLKEQTHPVHIQPGVSRNTNTSVSYEFTVSECFPYASLYQILWKMGKRRPKEN